ncbi:MAG: hypothetical protein MPK62_02130 [Alphaproteobacteria bacterium]|nr:hypothetical protein [Alphaproteobacteria bacterium]MDA8029932.1 hypothetical protein [Alphaproteobacteria bacterium]
MKFTPHLEDERLDKMNVDLPVETIKAIQTAVGEIIRTRDSSGENMQIHVGKRNGHYYVDFNFFDAVHAMPAKDMIHNLKNIDIMPVKYRYYDPDVWRGHARIRARIGRSWI